MITPGPPRVAGIVLAGGRSTRFGRDKLSELIGGTSLLQHAVSRVAETCDVVVVVVAPGAPAPGLVSTAPVRIVHDAAEAEGPLAGLLAGLVGVREPLAIVAAGDMPDLRASVLREMVRAASEGSSRAVALADGDGFRPLPCVLRTEAARAEARSLFDAGGRSLRSVLEALAVQVVPERVWTALDPERGTLRDVDRPQDLQAP